MLEQDAPSETNREKSGKQLIFIRGNRRSGYRLEKPQNGSNASYLSFSAPQE